jgi:hypothetical protein
MSQLNDEPGAAPLAPPRLLDLGESDSSLDTYPAFAAGHTIAISNVLGGFHRNLDKSQTVIEAFTGMGVVNETGTF